MRKISGLLLGIAAISMVSYLSAGITIIEAKYGKLNDKKKTKNVTSTLQSLVDGEDQFTINAGEYNKLFGDPAKKKAKQFYVKYNDGKNTHEKTVSYKESISFVAIRIALPPQPKPEPQSGPQTEQQIEIVNALFDPTIDAEEFKGMLANASREHLYNLKKIRIKEMMSLVFKGSKMNVDEVKKNASSKMAELLKEGGNKEYLRGVMIDSSYGFRGIFWGDDTGVQDPTIILSRGMYFAYMEALK